MLLKEGLIGLMNVNDLSLILISPSLMYVCNLVIFIQKLATPALHLFRSTSDGQYKYYENQEWACVKEVSNKYIWFRI